MTSGVAKGEKSDSDSDSDSDAAAQETRSKVLLKLEPARVECGLPARRKELHFPLCPINTKGRFSLRNWWMKAGGGRLLTTAAEKCEPSCLPTFGTLRELTSLHFFFPSLLLSFIFLILFFIFIFLSFDFLAGSAMVENRRF